MIHSTATNVPSGGLRHTWNAVADRLAMLVSHSLLALTARVAVGAIFFLSGRTKVEGFLTVSDSAYTLFREDYKVPLPPPEFAAHMATYAEHLFPILLVLGLFTSFSVYGLLPVCKWRVLLTSVRLLPYIRPVGEQCLLWP